MSRFRVTWVIDLERDDLDTPEDAARAALVIQRDPMSIATVFEVCKDDGSESVQVDLNPEAS